MQAIVHFLAGAAIASTVQDLPAVVGLSFFSHYILDLLPHIDPETFAARDRPYTLRQRLALTMDIILVTVGVAALFFFHWRGSVLLLGGIVAQLPDWLMPLERHGAFAPLRMIHEELHWAPKRAHRWSWYIAGLLTPAVVSALSLYAIFSS